MSDKHTDAQGELKRYAMSADQGGLIDGYESAHGEWYKASDVEAKIRATEGQAQTCAAKVWDASTPRDAAQLADSTAPGAPKLICPGCGMDRLKVPCPRMTDECAMSADAHLLAAPTAQQSLTAGGAVPEWKLARIQRMIAQYGSLSHTHWPLAPMTQLAEIMAAVKEIAAAPLPQVHSEALDERDVFRLAVELNIELTFRVDQGNCVVASESDSIRPRGKSSKYVIVKYVPESMFTSSYEPDVSHANYLVDTMKFVRGKEAAARKAVKLLAAQVMPVTPSGALTDNDGGVKS